LCGVAQRENFGVRGGIAMRDGAISGARDDLLVEDDDSADGDFAALGGFAGLVERFAHEGEIDDGIVRHGAKNITRHLTERNRGDVSRLLLDVQAAQKSRVGCHVRVLSR
jgi:hypothetical protein